ncbi:unnamed protein product [Adineta ricciae]|uniref:DDE Tnp4 domain-containing protein n=1 Tax=Adineta ricciae TaxID=249248 RepID=A0A816G3A5_ADIRI|nr:unnamed protein product [Adineta ricciae]CAF1669158.1 unnamed protein product [Adineta ricciae]
MKHYPSLCVLPMATIIDDDQSINDFSGFRSYNIFRMVFELFQSQLDEQELLGAPAFDYKTRTLFFQADYFNISQATVTRIVIWPTRVNTKSTTFQNEEELFWYSREHRLHGARDRTIYDSSRSARHMVHLQESQYSKRFAIWKSLSSNISIFWGGGIMADREFALDAIHPPFLGRHKKLSAEMVLTAWMVARNRIHVERCMGRLKNFILLNGIIPLKSIYSQVDHSGAVFADSSKFLAAGTDRAIIAWVFVLFLTVFDEPLVKII